MTTLHEHLAMWSAARTDCGAIVASRGFAFGVSACAAVWGFEDFEAASDASVDSGNDFDATVEQKRRSSPRRRMRRVKATTGETQATPGAWRAKWIWRCRMRQHHEQPVPLRRLHALRARLELSGRDLRFARLATTSVLEAGCSDNTSAGCRPGELHALYSADTRCRQVRRLVRVWYCALETISFAGG